MAQLCKNIFLLLAIFCTNIVFVALASETSTQPVREVREILRRVRASDLETVGGIAMLNRIVIKILEIDDKILNDPILDVGSGYGGAAAYMNKRGFIDITAIDLDQELIVYSGDTYPEISFQKLNALDIAKRLKEESFSLVYLLNTASEIKDKGELLQKIKRVTKPGGVLVILDYTLKKHGEGISVFSAPFLLDLAEVKLILNTIGWEILEIEDLSDNFAKWYKEELAALESYQELGILKDFTPEGVGVATDKVNNLLVSIEGQEVGGVLIIAKRK